MAVSSIIQVLTPDRSVLGYAAEPDSIIADLKQFVRESLDLKESTKIKLFYSGNKLSKKMFLVEVWIHPGWCLIAEIGGKKLPTKLNYQFQIEETGETVTMEIADQRLIRDIKTDLVQSVPGVHPGCFFMYRGMELQDLLFIGHIGIMDDIPIVVTRLNPDPRRSCLFTFKTPNSRVPRVGFSAKTPVREVAKALFPGERILVSFMYGKIPLDGACQIGDWKIQDGEIITVEIASKLSDGDGKKGIMKLFGNVRKGLGVQNRASSSRRIYSPSPPVSTYAHEEPAKTKDVFQMFDVPAYTDELPVGTPPVPSASPAPAPAEEVKPMIIERHDEADCQGLAAEKFIFRGFHFEQMFPEEHSEEEIREAIEKLIGIEVRIDKLTTGEYMVLSDSEEQPMVFCFRREGKRPIVLVHKSPEKVSMVKARICEILNTTSAFIALKYNDTVIEDYKKLTEVYKEGITIEEQVALLSFKVVEDPVFPVGRMPVVIQRPATIFELKQVLADRLKTLPKAMEISYDATIFEDSEVICGARTFTLKSLPISEKKIPVIRSGLSETCVLKYCPRDTVDSIAAEIAELYHVEQKERVILLDNNNPIHNGFLCIKAVKNLSVVIRETIKEFTYEGRTVRIAVDENTTVGDVIPDLSQLFHIPETQIDINSLEESDTPANSSEVKISDTNRFVVCDGDTRISITCDTPPTCRDAKNLIGDKLGLESNTFELEDAHKKLVMPWEHIPRTVIMLRLDPTTSTHVNVRVDRKEPVQVEIGDDTTISQVIGMLHKLGRKVDSLVYRGLILGISEKVSNLKLGPHDFLVGFEMVRENTF